MIRNLHEPGHTLRGADTSPVLMSLLHQNYPFAEMVKQGYFPGFIDVKNAHQNLETLADLFSVFKNNQREPVAGTATSRSMKCPIAWQARA